MTRHLPERVYEDILALARKHHVERVILFGSRARGDYWERSDIDLAVWGGNTRDFTLDADEPENIHTLLFIDVVRLDRLVQPKMREAIFREGIVLVGKLRESAG